MSIKPFIAAPGLPEDRPLNMDEYSEAFLYLHDEWAAVDTYLDRLGYPAQVKGPEGNETLSLVERIRQALDEKARAGDVEVDRPLHTEGRLGTNS